MLVLTTRKSIWFGMFLLCIFVGTSACAQVGAPTSQVIVSVHNDAHTPVGTLVSAETTASRTFPGSWPKRGMDELRRCREPRSYISLHESGLPDLPSYPDSIPRQ